MKVPTTFFAHMCVTRSCASSGFRSCRHKFAATHPVDLTSLHCIRKHHHTPYHLVALVHDTPLLHPRETSLIVHPKRCSMSADLSASLTVLCCTANLGNAKPTSQDMAAWIPPRGVLPNQDKKDTPSLTKPMDIIVIGMQESTWKTGASSSTKPEDRKDSSWSEYDSEEEDLVTTASATPAAAVSSSTPIATTTTATTATTSASPKTKKGNLALPAPAVPQILTTQISSLDAALTGMKQPDAVYLRDTLQETLGGDKDYQLVKEFQRGQMRLYLYCRPQWVNEITELDGTLCVWCDVCSSLAEIVCSQGGLCHAGRIP